jgi:tryptophan-rich sensory protein
MNAWYAQLNRPPLTPPNWIFGPVWTILYVMIALSITLYVRQTRSNPSIPAYILIGVHLISNACWTPLFVRLQCPGWALLDIILLDITLCLLIVIFWRVCRPASVLLWPYFGWVLFATYLNAGFFKLNPP